MRHQQHHPSSLWAIVLTIVGIIFLATVPPIGLLLLLLAFVIRRSGRAGQRRAFEAARHEILRQRERERIKAWLQA